MTPVTAQTVLTHTVVSQPRLCPEIRLRLVTPSCRLWRADEADLADLGLADPYWAFCWAGGQALARFILDRPERVRGRRVLAFGAGGGIEAIAAARSGAAKVCAADVDPVAAAAVALNAELNEVQIDTTCDDLLGCTDLPYDLILAADVCYEAGLAQDVVRWLHAVTKAGRVAALVADPKRGFVTGPMRALATYEASSDNDIDQSVTTHVFAMP